MSAKHTISINGTTYDALTGMPVDGPKTIQPVAVQVNTPPVTEVIVERLPARTAGKVHLITQKSVTLRRGHLSAPKTATHSLKPKRSAGHIARSPKIVHFASHPQPIKPSNKVVILSDIGPTAQTIAARIPTPEPHSIKEKLIQRAGEQIVTRPTVKKPSLFKRKNVFNLMKTSHLLTACFAILLLGGYVTYLNMPGLSIRIAAAQAGIDAKYPNYSPDGYSFAGPIDIQEGLVELHFKANGGGEGYTIRQKSSDWNSVAVLDNFVGQASGGDYKRTQQGGITVYTYKNQAAWTNGGVLYTIEGKAPLSNDQILRIASSM